MSAALLQSLLEGRLRDPDSGETVTVPTLKVAIAPSLRGSEAALIADLGLGKRLGIIADPATWQAMGARISGALSAQFTVAPVILPERPHADIETVQRVRAATGIADGLIAVGSGTINDLAKYAAFLDHKPYACFGTAPSMNGYTSVNAAIMEGGVKKSLSAAAARGVFLDVEILSKAPQRMIAAGFGDSICRPTAQADWLLAHLLLDQPYRTLPFQLLAEDEAALLAAPEGLLTGDSEAMTRLGAHARHVRLRHDDLRRQLSRQPGRTSDRAFPGDARRSGRGELPWRADRRDHAHHGADPRRVVAPGAGRASPPRRRRLERSCPSTAPRPAPSAGRALPARC